AEGSGKQSEKETNRFIETALGSAYETLANVDILKTNKFATEKDLADVQYAISGVCSQLGGLKKKLDL
ncbi:MAG: four helix bundle protein, partial [bacterium]|nr:four helix bundle protein [bacterium]